METDPVVSDIIKMIPLLCLLLSWFGASSAQEISYVNRPEGEDALLNCTLKFDENIEFDWRKDNKTIEVFQYKSGSHPGNFQDNQFENRVDFFQHELQTGNASIIIKNTRLGDNGIYTCGLLKENREEINIRLNVVGVLMSRDDPGAAEPHIYTIKDESTWRLLECRVKGVPNPEVKWINSAGKELAKHIPESENGQPHVDLQLIVTETDNYTCMATQRKIYHQKNSTLPVRVQDNFNFWMIISAVLGLVVVAAVSGIVYLIVKLHCFKRSSVV